MNFLKRHFFIFFIFLVIIIFFKIVDHPKFRYQVQDLRCQYQQIFTNKEEIDVAFFGSSRLLTSIDPLIFEQSYQNLFQEKIKVSNLARSWRGYGQIYQTVLDLYGKKQINKAVVIQYIKFEPNKNILSRDSQRFLFGKSVYYQGYYPEFFEAVTMRFLLKDIFSKTHQNFFFNLRDFFMLVSFKFINGLNKLENIKLIFLEDEKFSKFGDINYCYDENYDLLTWKNNFDNKQYLKKIDIILKNKINLNNWTNKNLNWDIDNINNIRSDFYLRKIISFFKEKNVDVYLMISPALNDGLPSPKFLNKIKTKYENVKIIYGNNDIYEKIYNIEGYRDNNHMITKSRNLWTKYIFDKVYKK